MTGSTVSFTGPADDDITRMVPDPRDRKCQRWLLGFKKGQARHIVDKHVKNTKEPWRDILDPELWLRLRTLKSDHRTSHDLAPLKSTILDHAFHSALARRRSRNKLAMPRSGQADARQIDQNPTGPRHTCHFQPRLETSVAQSET